MMGLQQGHDEFLRVMGLLTHLLIPLKTTPKSLGFLKGNSLVDLGA